MNNKVTLQDIADALGISRNTVSRAFNNSDAVSDTTKNKIFQKVLKLKKIFYAENMKGIHTIIML